MHMEGDSSNIFRRANYDQNYWDRYLTARPHYDQRFYRYIYEYHESNGGLRKIAHDVGTGPGQVAAELSRHFTHVVASDNNATHVAVARHRLDSASIPSQNMSFIECSAEALGQVYPADSADLIAVAECFPLLDAKTALKGFARLLKSRGTLAIWFYGRPIFTEPEYASRCQPIFDIILDTKFSKLIKGGGPQHVFGWQRSTDCTTSFLDNIELDGRTWQHVQRRKWNSRHPMPFYSPAACDFQITPMSRIKKEELIIETDESEFWLRHWNVEGAKMFVETLMPTFSENDPSGVVERKYTELGQAMGGKDAVRKITWPAILILASKR